MLAICRYGNGFEPEAPLVLPPLEEVTDEIALIVGNVCITMRNDRHDYRSIRRLAAFAQTIVVFFSDNGGCGRYAPQTQADASSALDGRNFLSALRTGKSDRKTMYRHLPSLPPWRGHAADRGHPRQKIQVG